jgi:hypothetical protein
MLKIIQLTNGILYDASAIPNVGVTNALKLFTPSNYPAINNISLFNDRIVVTGALGRQFNCTLTGVDGSFPVSEIGVLGNLQAAAVSLSGLFDQYVAIL